MKQLHVLFKNAYDLFDNHLSEEIEELSKDKKELRILDIGTGYHPRYLFHLLEIAIEKNISITFVCIDKAHIELKEDLVSLKDKCRETHNKVIVLNEDINICNSGKIKITKSVKDLAPFDIVLINATVHELHVNYAIDDYFPQIFESLSEILTKSGLLFIGDYYFPSYMIYSDRRRMVELQYEQSKHADPPEAFIEPDLLSKYFISYFNVLHNKQILLSPYDDKDLKKLYYVFVLKKKLLKNKTQIRVFRDKIDLILENIDESNIHKEISNFTKNIENHKASSNNENFNFEDFYKDFYRGDLFKSIAELVNKFIFEWNEFHGFNNLPQNSIWISYKSQFLKGNESRIDPMLEEGGVPLKYPYCFSDKTTISDFKNDLSFIAFNNFLNWDKINNNLSENHFKVEQIPSIYKWMIDIGKDDFLSVNLIPTDTNFENPGNRFLTHIENNKRAKHHYINLYENEFLSWDNELSKSLPKWDDQTNLYKSFLWSIFKNCKVQNDSSLEYYHNIWNSIEKPDYSYKFFSTLNLKLPNDTPLGTIMIFSDTVFDSKLLDSLIIILNRYFIKLNHIDTELNNYISFLKEKESTKQAEWESIFTDTFHTMKKFIGGLRYIEDNLSNGNNDAAKAIKYFRNQINILLELSRYSFNQKEYIEKFRRRDFTLFDVFDPLINMYSFAGSNFPKDAFKIGYSDRLKNAINAGNFWRYDDNELKEIKINGFKEIYDLIFADVLLNAIENNQPVDLWIEIEAKKRTDCIVISISNNSAISQNFKQSFANRKFIQGHLGIKIICMWSDALHWEINLPNKSFQEGGLSTKIEFLIPINN